MTGSVWDQVLDTKHMHVLRTYIERWPRTRGGNEKVLVIVVEPDEHTRHRCPTCDEHGRAVESGAVR